jgi:hypothetical protein
LDPSIDRATERKGSRWTAVEDSKLKDAVETHGGKNWAAIATLVPGRTRNQCRNKWNAALDLDIDRANGRTGSRWTAVEDSKLKDAVVTYGGKNWAAIAALVPGRTRNQCGSRWRDFLNPSIDRANGKWSEDEDSKLKDAVQTHGGKNWGLISALVPGRSRLQCTSRWHNTLDPSIDRESGRTGKWSEDEDIKLKNAVQTYDDSKNWNKISAVVPGRTSNQCKLRWRDALDPSIDLANGRTGSWRAVEDIKLKDAVGKHGGKNWGAISALVQGRTRRQCNKRWKKLMESNRSTGTVR